MDHQKLEKHVQLACQWLAEVAQVKEESLSGQTRDTVGFPYENWRGAIRGEYSAAKQQWSFYCPVWHTGQAVKALVMAGRYFRNDDWLEAARLGKEFIITHQLWDPQQPDHGLILAYEDFPTLVNTSAVMECMHGLMLLADHDGDTELWERLIAAGDFLLDKMYMPDLGLMKDAYDPATHQVQPPPYPTKDNKGGRPLLEDAVLVKLYEQTGRSEFLEAHIRISETLVADQNPPGNWIDYGPCDAERGAFHPRHTYWWGLPLLDTYRQTKRQEFLDTVVASGSFCCRGLRHDGGWIRGLYTDGTTDSFGHATSGSACAAILWLALAEESGEDDWPGWAEKAIDYCMNVQFTDAEDPNLQGSVLEKVLPPDGTDRTPYHLRDLGTIFFIQAGLHWLGREG
jgi:hypothetical protein